MRRRQLEQQQQGILASAAAAAGVNSGSNSSLSSLDSSLSSPVMVAVKMEEGAAASPQAEKVGRIVFFLNHVTSHRFLLKMASLSGLPGWDTLSANEKKLCLNLQLTPAHYISYKTW